MSEHNYSWAVNQTKLKRAIVEVGVDAPEEAVKAVYVKYGGLVREVELAENNETNMEPEQEKIVDAEVAAPAPEADAPVAETPAEVPAADAPTPEITA